MNALYTLHIHFRACPNPSSSTSCRSPPSSEMLSWSAWKTNGMQLQSQRTHAIARALRCCAMPPSGVFDEERRENILSKGKKCPVEYQKSWREAIFLHSFMCGRTVDDVRKRIRWLYTDMDSWIGACYQAEMKRCKKRREEGEEKRSVQAYFSVFIIFVPPSFYFAQLFLLVVRHSYYLGPPSLASNNFAWQQQ